MTLNFLRISKMRIFPRAAVQAKSASQSNLMPPNTLPRKIGALMRYKDVIKRSYSEHLSLERNPRNLSLDNSKQYATEASFVWAIL
jgi:hypothetical protein